MTSGYLPYLALKGFIDSYIEDVEGTQIPNLLVLGRKKENEIDKMKEEIQRQTETLAKFDPQTQTALIITDHTIHGDTLGNHIRTLREHNIKNIHAVSFSVYPGFLALSEEQRRQRIDDIKFIPGVIGPDDPEYKPIHAGQTWLSGWESHRDGIEDDEHKLPHALAKPSPTATYAQSLAYEIGKQLYQERQEYL